MPHCRVVRDAPVPVRPSCQLLEQRPGFPQVCRIKALGKLALDLRPAVREGLTDMDLGQRGRAARSLSRSPPPLRSVTATHGNPPISGGFPQEWQPLLGVCGPSSHGRTCPCTACEPWEDRVSLTKTVFYTKFWRTHGGTKHFGMAFAFKKGHKQRAQEQRARTGRTGNVLRLYNHARQAHDGAWQIA